MSAIFYAVFKKTNKKDNNAKLKEKLSDTDIADKYYMTIKIIKHFETVSSYNGIVHAFSS